MQAPTSNDVPDATRHADDYRVSAWWFLRLLGVVYAVAILSLWGQIDGLIGSEGILPIGERLERVRAALGPVESVLRMPTLCWIDASDGFLHLLCAVGLLLAVALIADVLPLGALAGLWVVYLSLTVAGQRFLGFQWDALLLETGLVAMLLLPWNLRPRLPGHAAPPMRAGLWLVWLLLFKLMVLSGVVKLLSMDETWWQLTALDVHYFTQPLPTWTSWYAHRLPEWFQKASVFLMFVIEIVVPFLIFVGARSRRVAFAALVLLQILIAGTGNYGFFNLLTVVLCVPLLDDRVFAALADRFEARAASESRPRRPWRWLAVVLAPVGTADDTFGYDTARPRWARLTATTLALAIGGVSAMTFARELVRTAPRNAFWQKADRWLATPAQEKVLNWTDPFRSVNGYGLFRAMTTRRPEIAIEASLDGREWREYDFRWKPDDPTERPRFVSPHMPRLDWQMWFAALNPRGSTGWLIGLARGLLADSRPIVALVGEHPTDEPPRLLRFVMWDYRFSTADERRQTGQWWVRDRKGILAGPMTLESLSPRRNE